MPSKPSCVDCGRSLSKLKYYRCDPCSRAEQRSLRAMLGGSKVPDRLRARWTKRNRLDNAAPGRWNRQRRRQLLARWQKQGRRCAYCLTGPADVIDHVIPLARGGTNFEGNLVPACSKCNHEKWDNLLSAWRYGVKAKRPPVTWVNLEPKPRALKKPRFWAEPVPMFSVCICGDTYSGRGEFCTNRCSQRTKYRRKMGIPDDLPAYHRMNGKETRRARTQAGSSLREAG